MDSYDFSSGRTPVQLGMLLYPGCIGSGALALADLLQAANLRMNQARFEVQWLSEVGGPFRLNEHVVIDTRPLSAATPHILVVPGGWQDEVAVRKFAKSALIQQLKLVHHSVRFLGYCTGVYLVAATGRLRGLPATTTWWLLDAAATDFPDVCWQPSASILASKIHATAAGANGYLPLGMGLIAEVCGGGVAEEIRNFMVLPRIRARQTPFQRLPVLLQKGPLMRDFFLWVEQCPAAVLNAEHLASHLNMSARTLARKVKGETGFRLGELMRLIKHHQVSEALLGTTKSVQQISNELGFADDTTLRRSFKQLTGLTPTDYRTQGFA